MTPDVQHFLLLCGFLFVAIAYSAVGHGGASGYLALLAFTAMPTKEASTLSLALNVIVSLIAFVMFSRAKHFDWRLAWPFILGSVPMSYLGGSLKLSDSLHEWILAIVLLYSGVTLILQKPPESCHLVEPPISWRILAGGAIGLVSGLVGVGGGIFLSPLILLLKWSEAKRTAAVTALFILVNSIAGLMARGSSIFTTIQNHSDSIMIACFGALLGAWFGSNRIPDSNLRKVLGVVLLFAVIRLLAR